MQAKDQNDNYICQKHNQPISLVVMDNGFKPVDQILCLQCMSLIRCPLNCVLGVNQAKEMIKEQLTNKFAEQKNTIKQQLGQLQTIHQDLIELRQRILKSIDTIDGVLSQWMNDLNSIQNDDLIDLIKGLEKLQMNHEEFSNLIEQNNQTFSTKLDSAFQILLKNEGFKDWHSKIIQLNFFFQKKGKEFNTNINKLTNQVLPITQQNFKQNALPQPLPQFSQLKTFNLQNLSQNQFPSYQLHNPNSVSQNNTNQRSNLNITPFKQIQSPVFPEANPHNKPPFFQVKQNEQQQQIQAQLNARLQRIKINLKKVGAKSLLHIPQQRFGKIETYNKIIFNNNGQILLAVKGKQIDVYSFDQLNLNLQTEIKGQANISCLKFSTTNQFFITGNESGQIQFWKQGENIKQWFFKNAEKKNSNKISFLFLTQNEKELISCNDKFIVFWKVKQEESPIEYKHHLVNQGQVHSKVLNNSIKRIHRRRVQKGKIRRNIFILKNYFKYQIFKIKKLFLQHRIKSTCQINQNRTALEFLFSQLYKQSLQMNQRHHQLQVMDIVFVYGNKIRVLNELCIVRLIFLGRVMVLQHFFLQMKINFLHHKGKIKQIVLLIYLSMRQKISKQQNYETLKSKQKMNKIFMALNPVYCKSKQILLQKSCSSFYLMQNPFLEQCNVDELQIKMEESHSHDIGTMTEDGDYLILTCFVQSSVFETSVWFDYYFLIFRISNEP